MPLHRTLIPAVVAIAALTAACSSGGGSSTPPSAATLKGIVVKQGDLPSGWTGKPAAASSKQDKNVSDQIAACVGVKGGGNKGQVKQIKSDDFSMSQSSISSDATSYKTAADVQDQVDLLKNTKTGGCLNSIFKKGIAAELPSTASITHESLKLDTSGNQVSSNVVGSVTGSVSVQVSGKTVTVYLAEDFITGHQLTGTVSFTSLGTALPSSLITSVTKAVAKRAASA